MERTSSGGRRVRVEEAEEGREEGYLWTYTGHPQSRSG